MCGSSSRWGLTKGGTRRCCGHLPWVWPLTSSATLLAFVRPALIRLFFIRNDGETFVPGIQSMGAGAFRGYALLGIVLHHIVVFVLEYFSFDYLVPMAISLGSSVVLTMLFVMAVERIFGHRS